LAVGFGLANGFNEPEEFLSEGDLYPLAYKYLIIGDLDMPAFLPK
jgi:hypothetical protein